MMYKLMTIVLLLLTVTVSTAQSITTYTGVLNVVYQESEDFSTSEILYSIYTDSDETIPLTIDASVLQQGGGLVKLNRQRVMVEVESAGFLPLEGIRSSGVVTSIALANSTRATR